ncbi:MAG: hypothetical protein U1E12_15510 [Hydrogenophaga sp.]|nr:hypothetical protein [Hydrogenophaga sp.]MDZ4103074.1 hypothetical protein [Hydrogenophaga sp.]
MIKLNELDELTQVARRFTADGDGVLGPFLDRAIQVKRQRDIGGEA